MRTSRTGPALSIALTLSLGLAACGTTEGGGSESSVGSLATGGASDATWDVADEVPVQLTGSSAESGGDAVVVDGGTVTVTAPGTYRLTGALSDGQVVVDAAGDGLVRVILDGVDITSRSGAALVVLKAERVEVVLEDGTDNALTDAEQYDFPDAETDEPNAALFSASDLVIGGSGSLVVTGRFNDGIASKDGLEIAGGRIAVQAVDDGLRGKDYVILRGRAEVAVSAGGDGIKSDNAKDADAGYVVVEAGSVTVDAGSDGIDAETDFLMTGGDASISAGDGDGARAIDANREFAIDGGTLVATDSNGAVTLASDASGQPVLGVALQSSVPSGSEVVIQEEDGTVVLSFVLVRATDTIVVSLPDLAAGATYVVVIGGTPVTTTSAA